MLLRQWINFTQDKVTTKPFNHFRISGHPGFLDDVSIKFTDKTDPSDPLKREDLETYA